jgi:hypothetical protein
MNELGTQLSIAVDSIVVEEANGNGSSSGLLHDAAQIAEEAARKSA